MISRNSLLATFRVPRGSKHHKEDADAVFKHGKPISIARDKTPGLVPLNEHSTEDPCYTNLHALGRAGSINERGLAANFRLV